MAYIPTQFEVDEQRENRRQDGMNEFTRSIVSGAQGFEENRRRALDEKNALLKQDMDLTNAGASASGIAKFRDGDSSQINTEMGATAKEIRDRRVQDAQLNREYRLSQIKKNNETPRDNQPKEKLTLEQQLDIKAAHAEKNQKVSPDQRKVATFATRIDQAEKDFSTLEEGGFSRASLSAGFQSSLPDSAKSENLRKQDQAERNFVNSVLRRESGAAIAPTEFESAEKQYFPRVGDSDSVIAQKKKNRDIVQAGLKAEAGEKGLAEIQREMGGSQPAPQTQAIDVKKMSREEKLRILNGQ